VVAAAAREAGAPSLDRRRIDAVARLVGRPGGRSVDLGEGLVAETDSAWLTVGPSASASPPPPEVCLGAPGIAAFGEWRIAVGEPAGVPPEVVTTMAGRESFLVRARRPGDRMRVRRSGRSRTLQNLFVDAGVPRGDRASWPVVVDTDGVIAWVPGVAEGWPAPTAGEGVRLAAWRVGVGPRARRG
jgi:tRNA(Ile)-lysidine synthetase-like protein